MIQTFVTKEVHQIAHDLKLFVHPKMKPTLMSFQTPETFVHLWTEINIFHKKSKSSLILYNSNGSDKV